ncbi:hypothetical protein TI39_contig4223g00006 [Zymoseptoria brevis]|uniref:Uncharacterized protein n=1 Tax=Zymoseptoria brevis TaxID=1047168 RepID=A0A0F4G9M8_9PEZI|nr:hypothetical protein TI39_contig4223g00006 [Zymoseptoria brevis]
MKSNTYLNSCVEQAAKSPLHYRHGAIVVRGGKIIGQGYNCYRPGFDGGSLKSGRIANKHLDGDAKAALKTKLKKKDKDHPQSQQDAGGNFIPFEGMSRGGGPNVNTPLSMHSEMMAIHSALAASSTLSSTAFSREKPCFKLPREDKRKSRLRRDVLLSYVAAICQTSSGSGQWQVKLETRNYNNGKEEEDEDVAEQEEPDRAFQAGKSGAKHHWKKDWKGKHGKKKYQYEGQYGQYGTTGQHHHEQASPSASNKSSMSGNASRGNDVMTIDNDDENDGTKETTTKSRSTGSETSCASRKRGNYYNQPGMRSNISPKPPAPQQHFLMPVGRAAEQRHSVAQRKKHPRLQGADLYVTRLGWAGKPQCQPRRSTGKAAARREKYRSTTLEPTSSTPEDDNASVSSEDTTLTDSISTLSISSVDNGSVASKPASLHDELLYPDPTPKFPPPTSSCGHASTFDPSQIHASRPCYRCISFMHAVGIRRVFWTNDAGEWEGGKVAELVEAMDGGFEDGGEGGAGGGGGLMGNGVFVTKHEVLMLRRMMGAEGGGGGGMVGKKGKGGAREGK